MSNSLDIKVHKNFVPDGFNMIHFRKFSIVHNAIISKYKIIDIFFDKYILRCNQSNNVVLVVPINIKELLDESPEYKMLDAMLSRIKLNCFTLGFTVDNMKCLNELYTNLKRDGYIWKDATDFVTQINQVTFGVIEEGELLWVVGNITFGVDK